MPRDGGNTGENSPFRKPTIDKFLSVNPLDIMTINKDGKWLNYSNQQADNKFLTRGQMMDMINAGSLNPLGTYDTAGAAYDAFMGMNPYTSAGTRTNQGMQVAGGARPWSQQVNTHAPVNWGSMWSPMFMPATVAPTTPAPTTPPPGPTPQNANLTPTYGQAAPNAQNIAAQRANTGQAAPITRDQLAFSAMNWANSPWQQNMLMSGDKYGEFGTQRGL